MAINRRCRRFCLGVTILQHKGDNMSVELAKWPYRPGTNAGGRGTDGFAVVLAAALAVFGGALRAPGCAFVRGGVSTDCR